MNFGNFRNGSFAGVACCDQAYYCRSANADAARKAMCDGLLLSLERNRLLKRDDKIVADVIPVDHGLLACDYCGADIHCDECGDMPERCPGCGSELDYRDLEV